MSRCSSPQPGSAGRKLTHRHPGRGCFMDESLVPDGQGNYMGLPHAARNWPLQVKPLDAVKLAPRQAEWEAGDAVEVVPRLMLGTSVSDGEKVAMLLLRITSYFSRKAWSVRRERERHAAASVVADATAHRGRGARAVVATASLVSKRKTHQELVNARWARASPFCALGS
eukprot:COSAG01_NODE_1248_length_11071_cov_30.622676_3_plen_170_part_00